MVQRANKKGDGRRPRIGVSLPEEDFEWLRSLNPKDGVANSDSYLVARVVRAARLSGLQLDDAIGPGRSLTDFHVWLKDQKKKDKLAAAVEGLLSRFFGV